MTRPESALSLVQRVALLCGPTETVEQPRQLAAEILGEISRHGCVEAVTALRDALNDSLGRSLSPQLQESANGGFGRTPDALPNIALTHQALQALIVADALPMNAEAKAASH